MRFYAGVPLTTRDGFNLGTINVIDQQPREVSPAEIATLQDLAGIVIDELEIRLAARMEAKRVDQIMADFIATVSHEMRTPLASVYGAAKTLHRGDGSIDSPTREQLLSMLEQGSERLTEIVAQILAARQLELSQPDGVSETFAPASLIRSVVDAAPDRGATRAIAVVDAAAPPTLRGDASTLRKILEQLLENATAHTPSGGQIEVGVEQYAEGTRFWVADDGPGIPEAERERIFEKFYRLDPTNRDGDGGIGLGLYTCRLLADRIRARVAVEPDDGGGSRFVIELPFTPSADNGPSTSRSTRTIVYRSSRRGRCSSEGNGHNP